MLSAANSAIESRRPGNAGARLLHGLRILRESVDQIGGTPIARTTMHMIGFDARHYTRLGNVAGRAEIVQKLIGANHINKRMNATDERDGFT